MTVIHINSYMEQTIVLLQKNKTIPINPSLYCIMHDCTKKNAITKWLYQFKVVFSDFTWFFIFLQNAFERDQIVLNYIHLTKYTAIVQCM